MDQTFLFQLHSKAQRETVVDDFLGDLPRATSLNLLDTAIWRDDDTRQFLVVDTSGRFEWGENLFVGQADDPGPFILGCKEYWGTERPLVQRKF